MKRKVMIIGAGASGMLAAITAAKAGAEVVLLEHGERVGKKLLSTGNGRCNFTNNTLSAECYRSEQPSFVMPSFMQFSHKDTIEFFQALGIYCEEQKGRLYPRSGQAASILDVLRMELKSRGVTVKTGVHVRELVRGKEGSWVANTGAGEERAERVILATGSKAAPFTGSDGSGYEIARALGHSLIPVLPALTALRCQGNYFKSLAGVRVQAKVSLWSGEACIAQEHGEVQLTGYGISGIPVFQVSRFASKALQEKRQVTAKLDFLEELSREELLLFLQRRQKAHPKRNGEVYLTGIFPKKLALVLLKESGISLTKPVGEVAENRWEKLADCIKEFAVEVIAPNGYEQAQVCAGGVSVAEVSAQTLESKRHRGLYFAGEILDVDGICGGYNLQWAWSSGHTAGFHAATDEEQGKRI